MRSVLILLVVLVADLSCIRAQAPPSPAAEGGAANATAGGNKTGNGTAGADYAYSPGGKSPDGKAPDGKGPDGKSPDGKGPDGKGPGADGKSPAGDGKSPGADETIPTTAADKAEGLKIANSVIGKLKVLNKWLEGIVLNWDNIAKKAGGGAGATAAGGNATAGGGNATASGGNGTAASGANATAGGGKGAGGSNGTVAADTVMEEAHRGRLRGKMGRFDREMEEAHYDDSEGMMPVPARVRGKAKFIEETNYEESHNDNIEDQ